MENFERDVFRIPEKRPETLEKGSVEQFGVLDIARIREISQENATKKVQNQEFLSSNKERLNDYELFTSIGEALMVLRDKRLREEELKEEKLKYAA